MVHLDCLAVPFSERDIAISSTLVDLDNDCDPRCRYFRPFRQFSMMRCVWGSVVDRTRCLHHYFMLCQDVEWRHSVQHLLAKVPDTAVQGELH